MLYVHTLKPTTRDRMMNMFSTLEAAEIIHQFRDHRTLIEDQRSVPCTLSRQFTTPCSSSSKGSNTFLWPQRDCTRVHRHTCIRITANKINVKLEKSCISLSLGLPCSALCFQGPCANMDIPVFYPEDHKTLFFSGTCCFQVIVLGFTWVN